MSRKNQLIEEENLFSNLSDFDQIPMAWSRLLACVTHDLTSPLITIQMMADNLKQVLGGMLTATANQKPLIDPELAQKRLQAAEETVGEKGIQHKITHLLKFLHSVSTYTKKVLPRTSENQLSMTTCIKQALTQLPPVERKDRPVLKIDYTNDFHFKCDVIFIEALLSNLFENAFYQMRQTGKGELRVWMDVSTHFSILHVKDTVGSMNDNKFKHLFDRFFSIRNEEIIPGFGFCRLALLHRGGNIKCQYKEGEYTEFRIEFSKLQN